MSELFHKYSIKIDPIAELLKANLIVGNYSQEKYVDTPRHK